MTFLNRIELSADSKKLLKKVHNKKSILNDESKKLLDKVKSKKKDKVFVSIEEITGEILADAVNRKKRFQQEKLRASLLRDISGSFPKEDHPVTPSRFPRLKRAYNGLKKALRILLLPLLALGGTYLAISEGFDSTAILNIFSSVPTPVILITGVVFSALSMILFYGFDLVEISNNLGINYKNMPKQLDVYLEQVEQVKQIKDQINKAFHNISCPDELEKMQNLAMTLAQSYQALGSAQEIYKKKLKNPFLKILKLGVALLTGTMLFAGGFFGAQALAVLVGSFILGPVAVTCWPIIALSVLGGVFAFGIYWFVERPGIENLVGRWFGLDKEKIEKFIGEKEAISAELEQLPKNIINHAKVTIPGNEKFDSFPEEKQVIEKSGRFNHTKNDNFSSNHTYGFFPRSKSMNDLRKPHTDEPPSVQPVF